jgi:hypothetical protein
MNGMNALLLAILAATLEAGLWAYWFLLIRRVSVPDDRRLYVLAHVCGLGLGLVSLALGSGPTVHFFGALAVVGAAGFLALRAQSAQPRLVPAVAPGDPILDFTLRDHRGRPFDSASLRGRPVLLKFFRGHW